MLPKLDIARDRRITLETLTAIEALPAEHIDMLKLKHELGEELEYEDKYILFYMLKIRELRETQKKMNEEINERAIPRF